MTEDILPNFITGGNALFIEGAFVAQFNNKMLNNDKQKERIKFFMLIILLYTSKMEFIIVTIVYLLKIPCRTAQQL
jgi:hypothetical protein